MREIKFRKWDRYTESMHSDVQIGIYEDPDEIMPFGKILDFACYEVMQYTGLKDKNGKEIYEGDIVIANLKYFHIKNEKCKVIFKNGYFGIQYGYCDDYFKSFLAWDDFEVIGNIYENPELLKGEEE